VSSLEENYIEMSEPEKEIAEMKAKIGRVEKEIDEVKDILKKEGKTMVEISESMQSKYDIE